MTLLELEGFNALRQNSSLKKTGRAAAGRGYLNDENTEEEDTETEAQTPGTPELDSPRTTATSSTHINTHTPFKLNHNRNNTLISAKVINTILRNIKSNRKYLNKNLLKLLLKTTLASQ